MNDEELGRVSLEISLLAKLDHPNIVNVCNRLPLILVTLDTCHWCPLPLKLLQLVEVFENKEYFQLVMEKHGTGIDLFEFIEKNPDIDEKLASYIFRQVILKSGCTALCCTSTAYDVHSDAYVSTRRW